jgi:hypothetical protein
MSYTTSQNTSQLMPCGEAAGVRVLRQADKVEKHIMISPAWSLVEVQTRHNTTCLQRLVNCQAEEGGRVGKGVVYHKPVMMWRVYLRKGFGMWRGLGANREQQDQKENSVSRKCKEIKERCDDIEQGCLISNSRRATLLRKLGKARGPQPV